MSKGRLEAFSDGVIAIVITIMLLELTALLGIHDRESALAAALGPDRKGKLSVVV